VENAQALVVNTPPVTFYQRGRSKSLSDLTVGRCIEPVENAPPALP
jgi:hypothetical protein